MADTQPPRPSPRPEYPPELERETPSGVHRALSSELNWQGAKMTAAMVVVAIGTAFGAYRVVLNEALAQTDAGNAVHESRIKALEQQVPQLREEVYQGRLDTQALYNATITHKRQERLERELVPPSKDGGP